MSKGIAAKRLEYYAAWAGIALVRALPFEVTNAVCAVLGNLFYKALPRRRAIALENLRHAFAGEKSEAEIRSLARRSCRSFLLTAAEIIKFHPRGTISPHGRTSGYDPEYIRRLFIKTKIIHDQAGGCIFVTPHLGNWEMLAYVAGLLEVPLSIVARPLDNERLDKLLFASRSLSGRVIVPTKNTLFMLQQALREGGSIAMLADQSTMRGVSVDFFGRKASTNPIPALLAYRYKRPIVVLACCRTEDKRRFEGYVSDPIWPEKEKNEKAEIIRMTEEMNRRMEEIIRKHPDQYLWMHNRWKKYKVRGFLS